MKQYFHNYAVLSLGLITGLLGFALASYVADTTVSVLIGIVAGLAAMLIFMLYLYRQDERYRAFEIQHAGQVLEKIKASCIQDGKVRKGCVYALEDSLCVVYGGSNPPAELEIPYLDVKIVSSQNDELHIACPSSNVTLKSKDLAKIAQQIESKSANDQ